MKRSMWLKMAVVLFVFTVVLGAVAADGSGKIAVTTPVQLNGKQIAAGDYKLTWTGTDNVQVSFKQGKNEVATAAAKLVQRKDASPYTAVVQDNGKMKEITFSGKTSVLVFE